MSEHPFEDRLSTDEAAAFAGLPRATGGHDQLGEERALRALRSAGLLAPPARRSPAPIRAIAAGVAAALVIFAAGTTFGRYLGTREAGSASPSAQVQRTGSAYVAALIHLSNAQTDERSSGIEAGAATLRAAATSLAQVAPNDPIVLRLRTSLNPGASNIYPAGSRPVVWF